MDRGAQFLNTPVDLSFRDQNFSFNHRSHDTQNCFATVVAQGSFFRDQPGEFEKNSLLVAGVGRAAFRRGRDRAGSMMKCTGEPHLFGIFFGFGQDIVPEAKADHHFQRHRHEAFRLQCVFL